MSGEQHRETGTGERGRPRRNITPHNYKEASKSGFKMAEPGKRKGGKSFDNNDVGSGVAHEEGQEPDESSKTKGHGEGEDGKSVKSAKSQKSGKSGRSGKTHATDRTRSRSKTAWLSDKSEVESKPVSIGGGI